MKVLVAGDFCPQSRVARLFKKKDFSVVLSNIKTVVSQSNYSILNFECPIASDTAKPIEKWGPNLKCEESGVEAVKWLGFKCVTIANNHILDYGEEALKNTINAFNLFDIDYVGGGMNYQDATKILYKQIEDKSIAIINCCEHEFSIASERTAGAAPLNAIRQYYFIKEAKTKADYILVIVHGGHEHFQYPSLRMQETYRFFIDAGADAVVNHHQHCYSGYEKYKDGIIFYGLGNFCFDWDPIKKDDLWNYGYMVNLEFNEGPLKFEIIPYNQCGEDPKITLLPKDSFNNNLQALNKIISQSDELRKVVDNYYTTTLKLSHRLFEPYQNRFLLGAQMRGWLPYFIGKNHRLSLQNNIMCEAHLDKIKYFLEYIYKNN